MEKERCQQLPPMLIERMDQEKEYLTYSTWIKSHWTVAKTTMLDTQNKIVPLTQPPLDSPLYIGDKHRFLLDLDNGPLKDAVEKYVAKEPDCKFWQQFDPKSCSWKLVLEELDNAKMLYHEKGSRNPARRFFRRGAAIARNLEPLLAGIPQENGVGFLQGALRVIFHAIKRRSDTCDKIFAVFESLPETLMLAERLREIFANGERFLQCLGSLHYELTQCIPRLIDILLRRGTHSAIKKHTKSLLGDGLAELDGILKPVKLAEENLDRCWDELDSRGIIEASRHAQSADEKLDTVSQQVSEIDLKQSDLNSTISTLSPVLQTFVVDMSKKMEEQYRTTRDTNRIINELYVMVHEMERARADDWRPSNQVHSLDSPSPKRRVQLRLTVQVSISACTDDEQDVYRQDLPAVQRAYRNFDGKSMEHANYLLLTPRFMQWLANFGSDMLLVDSHCTGKGVGRISSMSVFCAGLAETLLTNASQDVLEISLPFRPRIVLSFFVGQHAGHGNVLAGPHGMMRCLIDQLLAQWPDDAPNIDADPDVSDPEAFRNADIGFLCHVFEQLLVQLGPEHPVCCIIDGISYFKTRLRGWEDELRDVVECFLDMIDRQREESGFDTEMAPVKFLLTSPEKSIRLRSVVPIDSHIDLRAGNTNTQSWLPSPGQ